MKKNKYLLILILYLSVVIVIIPLITNLPSTFKVFDFSTSGDIGSFIGGVTSPFINSLSAILLYLAYTKQIESNGHLLTSNNHLLESNNLLENQNISKNILEQIRIFENNDLNIDKAALELYNNPETIAKVESYARFRLDKIIFFLNDINLTYKLINNFDQSKNKEYLYKKLYFVYKLRFEYHIDLLKKEIDILSINEMNCIIITEFLDVQKEIKSNITTPNKFNQN